MAFIKIDNLTHIFSNNDKTQLGIKALDNINLEIAKGDFIAIIGVNGSGKSTLAKHFNGLLLPMEGKVSVDDILVDDSPRIWDIRQRVSMVFQNPDNQIIATIVEDDIAFGPENLGIGPEEIRQRVDFALESLGISHLRYMAPHLLSGGQKQLVAIAGALAMRTDCIVLDEPTAMLDPQGRQLVMQALHDLHEKYKITIIIITHFMEEALQADNVLVMDNGKIVLSGRPQEVFKQQQKLEAIGLAVPLAIDIANRLRQQGISLDSDILTNEDLANALVSEWRQEYGN